MATRQAKFLIIMASVLLWFSSGCERREDNMFKLVDTTLVIPQVDYEGAIYYREEDPYPHLNFEKVKRGTVIQKTHRAVFLENEYIKLTILPEMGRVYSLFYKPTGHEQLWRNDIVTVGEGLNDTGWWIWIGGVEYTLPGDEHGTTWAMPWTYQVIEDSDTRKTIRMEVQELGTKLVESISISLYPGKAYYEAEIKITNPMDKTVYYAHWVNPQWTPGGRNELTDNTEFIIPTDRILINKRWQANMGPSPQDWAGNPLRFIRGWRGGGDLMADGLKAGFYSAYSHDEEEGIVRVFDKDKTPGMDIWTYGFHTSDIPMGSGAPNKGYAEMWGGTSKMYPDERHPLEPGQSIRWKEWMYPYQKTGGLTYADTEAAVSFRVYWEKRQAAISICPSGKMEGEIIFGTAVGREALAPGKPLSATALEGEISLPSGIKIDFSFASGFQFRKSFRASPSEPLSLTVDLSSLTDKEVDELVLFVGEKTEEGQKQGRIIVPETVE